MVLILSISVCSKFFIFSLASSYILFTSFSESVLNIILSFNEAIFFTISSKLIPILYMLKIFLYISIAVPIEDSTVFSKIFFTELLNSTCFFLPSFIILSIPSLKLFNMSVIELSPGNSSIFSFTNTNSFSFSIILFSKHI